MDETRLDAIERELAVLTRDCDGHFYTIGTRIREVRASITGSRLRLSVPIEGLCDHLRALLRAAGCA